MNRKTCAFSGHRVLGGDFDYKILDRVIDHLIQNGYDRFLCGMAVGFDQLAAQSVIGHKQNYPVELVACVPCSSQSDVFSSGQRDLYGSILSRCDETIVLSDFYFRGCMQQRNRFLVDNCDVLVCYLRKKSGGTFYTVEYARKKQKKIIEL